MGEKKIEREEERGKGRKGKGEDGKGERKWRGEDGERSS